MANNAETAGQMVECFNRRDLAGFLAHIDEEIEYLPLFRADGWRRGHAGMQRWWDDLLEAVPDAKIEIVDWLESGDVAVAHMRIRGRGAGSDAPIDQDVWQVGTWRGGKCVSGTNHPTESAALKAAGLSA